MSIKEQMLSRCRDTADLLARLKERAEAEGLEELSFSADSALAAYGRKIELLNDPDLVVTVADPRIGHERQGTAYDPHAVGYERTGRDSGK